jgi:hypothetical protein
VGGYWEARRGFAYYDKVVRLARRHAAEGGAALDVGAHETRLLQRLDWFDRRVALDADRVEPGDGVAGIVADFERFEPRERFDLALCLQVLEHLERPGPFARKLLATAPTAIVSVPHRWPPWTTDEHLHDPVDAAKLRRWTGHEPDETSVVEDLGMERLIAVYRGAVSTSST